MIISSDSSLTVEQQQAAAAVLGQAFAGYPFMAYVFPDAETRVQQLTKLFLPVIRCGLRCGGVEITDDGSGVLVWVSGKFFDWPIQAFELIRSGLIGIPLSIGLPAFRRLMAHDTACEHALIQRSPKDFAYLWAIGIRPSAAGRGLGKQLIRTTMDAMRRRGHSTCVLRTETAKNVSIYEHLGFRQVLVDTPEASGIQYWLMSQEL